MTGALDDAACDLKTAQECLGARSVDADVDMSACAMIIASQLQNVAESLANLNIHDSMKECVAMLMGKGDGQGRGFDRLGDIEEAIKANTDVLERILTLMEKAGD